MNDLVIALDVGGTNTRARTSAVTDGEERRPATADITTRAASLRDLRAFIGQVVRTAGSLGSVTAAVVAVAGPVVGDRGRVTNWPSDSAVAVSDLESAGLPLGRTRLVNDAAAGAWGALSRVDCAVPDVRAETLVARRGGDRALVDGCLVYVAPGTGLSAASIVRHGLGPLGASVVACELENTQMPRFEGAIGEIADVLAQALGRAPDWEDLVSGRGLVHTYDAMVAVAGVPSGVSADRTHRAAAIAQAALAGKDVQAMAAIDVFYRTLGHFAQTLALTCLPCAAVVIGGASTERNLELLRGSALAETFAKHRRFGDLLRDVPLYAVGGEVNLEGAVRLAVQAR